MSANTDQLHLRDVNRGGCVKHLFRRRPSFDYLERRCNPSVAALFNPLTGALSIDDIGDQSSYIMISVMGNGSIGVFTDGSQINVAGGVPDLLNTGSIGINAGGGNDIIEINLGNGLVRASIDIESDGGDLLILRGHTLLRNTVDIGVNGINLNGDDQIDVKVRGIGRFRFYGGGEKDHINARGSSTVGDMLNANFELFGEAGNDTMIGADGDDTMDGGEGDDSLQGMGGNDLIDGQAGDDVLDGGDGNDQMRGSSGNDTMLGGNGNDNLDGGDGSDNLDGGEGNDSLRGGTADDIMQGGFGDDTVDGGEGNDTIQGGEGNDVLIGGQGVDSIDGGTGADTIVDAPNPKFTLMDKRLFGADIDTLTGIENVDPASGAGANILDLLGSNEEGTPAGTATDAFLTNASLPDVSRGNAGTARVRDGIGLDVRESAVEIEPLTSNRSRKSISDSEGKGVLRDHGTHVLDSGNRSNVDSRRGTKPINAGLGFDILFIQYGIDTWLNGVDIRRHK